MIQGDNMRKEINVDKENTIRILDYWIVMEFLNQQSLKTYKDKGKKTFSYKKELKAGNVKPKKVVEDFVQFKSGDNLQTITKADSEVKYKIVT